jgi:16S rRNA (guanine1207-N2)-methyltransferase
MSHDSHPSTQILQRNLEHLSGLVLMINPVELASVETALTKTTKKNLTISCQDYSLYRKAKSAGFPAVFETHRVSKGNFDTVIVFLPKSDAEIEMVLAWASECLGKDGKLILIGQNNAGIKSAKKTLEKFIGPVTFSDAARHSAFYVAHKTIKLKKFNLDDYWQSYEVALSPQVSRLTAHVFSVFSLPGTFSHGHLDEGTALLLGTLDAPLEAKHILDWGCGAGAIGAVLASLHPAATVDMVDSNALAIASAQKTITENKLTHCKVFASDIFSDITDTYDYMVANPPFHKGHDTYYADVEQFLREAKNHLHENGRLRVVANMFLRYDEPLEQQFGYVKTLIKTNKYKVLEAVKVPSKPAAKSKKRRKPEKLSLHEIDELE